MKKILSIFVAVFAFTAILSAAPSMNVSLEKQCIQPGELLKITIQYQLGQDEKISCYYVRGFAAEMPKAAQDSNLFNCRVNKKDPRWTNYDIVKPVFFKITPEELANGKIITIDTAKLPEGDYKLRFYTSFYNSGTKKYSDLYRYLVFCVAASEEK